jgi:tRNA(adenine34) deaminase
MPRALRRSHFQGSLGIACVIADSQGALVSEGRNQLFDDCPSTNFAKCNSVAHAELNALGNLPQSHRRDKSVILYATVEPCPMCAGAIVMSSVRKVRIASKDAWAGATHLWRTDSYMAGKKIEVENEGGFLEEMFFYLHQLSQEGRLSKNHPYYAQMSEQYPHYFKNLARLLERPVLMEALSKGSVDGFLSEYRSFRSGGDCV